MTKRRCHFNSKYMLALMPVASKGDVRYYLNQTINVSRAPKGDGVLLVSTDGHRLLVIHDRDGHTNQTWTCTITKTLLDAAKNARKGKESILSLVAFADDTATVHKPGVSENLYSNKMSQSVVAMEYNAPLECKFPEWEHLITPMLRAPWSKPKEVLQLNPRYLATIQTVAKIISDNPSGYLAVDIYTYSHQPALIQFNGHEADPVAIMLIMPMRASICSTPLPGWLRQATGNYTRRKRSQAKRTGELQGKDE